ncbi:sensor histidine kinase [Nocardioides mangrovi]|uniref:Sensor-like histidine kinase SenX3 n=1 Tax=Nocardioides mangrovi TaxID=2874580 RepID=A0ABS7UGM5_9ACTN|nr:PAS domain-containing sensor histidine kinase [Nocardioides mangrovi]MBZ5739752.1 PAS domain-containing sensor histidine kinase [Nocardioides mangrovi]
MTRVRLLDQAGFAAFFVLAAVLGRQTVPGDGGLALAWPAAGVAAAWFAATGWQRLLVADALVMFVCAWAVNDLTGAPSRLALGLAVGTVVQVVVFGVLLSRWCPAMWGFGDEPPPGVQGQRDLGLLMAASLLSAVAAALTGPTTILFLTDGSWVALVTWVLRNAVAVLAIFPLSLLARNAARAREAEGLAGIGRGGFIEAGFLGLVTIVAAWLVFVVNDELPVPFLLLGTCVWAGARFSSWVADIHALLVAAAVVLFTLLGEGPFSTIDDVDTRQIVVQSYIVVVVSINLVLSVARREGLRLNRRIARAEVEQRNQATMLRTILDTMADGVSVLGADGRLVLRNPAAAHLVGETRTDDQGRVESSSYGIFHVDGREIAPGEGPIARAMTGEVGEPLDVFVRNAAAPDGRVLAVTARPVPDSDPPLVVSVYHDVTSDRRERDELASFAGVVAHDLLNPLTVVEGWSEALLEEARAGVAVPPDMQADQLERIVRAAQRMQHLISDLLAYTTARDLRINPVRVDLRAVAADVARARVDAARVQDAEPPQIVVPPALPAVLAEPVLLRQVIDNLVGNAVKYVAPGTVPEIVVAATVLAEGNGQPMVLIEVSDNGIGIPEDQQSRVFDTFHRAHADSGYRGTGLGLSIVKRIAERHEGTAWAATNAATGGTTMSVTFPAADRD